MIHPTPSNMHEPPSYDAVVSAQNTSSPSVSYTSSPQMSQGGYQLQGQSKAVDSKAAQQHPVDSKTAPPSSPQMQPATYPSTVPSSSTATTVYHYQNPRTGEMISSLLPPDHPEMICLQAGEHNTKARYGIVGILAAVFWFPLGVGLCLLDRKVTCKRCGVVVHHGILD
ncbi:hypothetical protein FRB99_004005 [Tulasnella sp. 403]|nr:hypothetical protein FRB99_004005 [Tulasnella sp. 403]